MATYLYGHPSTRTNGQFSRRSWDALLLGGPPTLVCTRGFQAKLAHAYLARNIQAKLAYALFQELRLQARLAPIWF